MPMSVPVGRDRPLLWQKLSNSAPTAEFHLPAEDLTMQSDSERFSRRHFLRWTAAGAAAAGTPWLLPTAAAQSPVSPTGERAEPTHTVVLRSPQLEVILDTASGLPWRTNQRHNLPNGSMELPDSVVSSGELSHDPDFGILPLRPNFWRIGSGRVHSSLSSRSFHVVCRDGLCRRDSSIPAD
jgi:hypothetical protein